MTKTLQKWPVPNLADPWQVHPHQYTWADAIDDLQPRCQLVGTSFELHWGTALICIKSRTQIHIKSLSWTSTIEEGEGPVVIQRVLHNGSVIMGAVPGAPGVPGARSTQHRPTEIDVRLTKLNVLLGSDEDHLLFIARVEPISARGFISMQATCDKPDRIHLDVKVVDLMPVDPLDVSFARHIAAAFE